VSPNRPHEPLYNIWQPLLGHIQTVVHRADLAAVLITVQNVEVTATLGFFTDTEITKNTYYKGLETARLGSRADLWIPLFGTIQQKHIKLNLN